MAEDGSLRRQGGCTGYDGKECRGQRNRGGVTISGKRSYGRFTRQVLLPAGADRDKAEATFRGGVLEISFLLKEEAKQKKIEVKSSSSDEGGAWKTGRPLRPA